MRNVIVTGASRGLGFGIVQRLVHDGFRVVAVARRPSPALTELIETTGGPDVTIGFRAFDLEQVDGLAEFVRAVRSEFGPVYGLVNNAGLGTAGVLATMSTADIERLIRLNTVSPVMLTKFVVRSMLAQGAGRIVNMSSVTALTGFSGLSVYSATKASMIGFTKALAREVGRVGITVNAVAPGFVETDLTVGIAGEQLARVARRSALKRLAKVEDVANAVAFLISDAARNITGTVMTVDAGGLA